MKTPNKLTDKSAALLVGTDVLDLYLKKIGWNMRTMMGQADVLETAILEMKKRLCENQIFIQSVLEANAYSDCRRE